MNGAQEDYFRKTFQDRMGTYITPVKQLQNYSLVFTLIATNEIQISFRRIIIPDSQFLQLAF